MPAHRAVNEEGPNRWGYWRIEGYGNPGCQGLLLWDEEGGGEITACTDGRPLAASYKWVVQQLTVFRSWVETDVCQRRMPDSADWFRNVVHGSREQPQEDCVNTGVVGYEVQIGF